MMQFSSLDQDQYEVIGKELIYLKIFPFILEDFVCREDAKEMMRSNNLPVSTTVSTTTNTVVTTDPVTGTGTGIGSGTGSGTGNTQPVYIGDKANAASLLLKEQHKTELEAGGKTVKGFTSSIEKAIGN